MKKTEGWFDIHCHLLPEVDDGAKDWDMSREMLGTAFKEGVRDIILTPHYHKRFKNISGQALTDKYNEFVKMAKEVDESLNIYLGNELYYSHDAEEWLENGTVRTMADTDYVLVEFSPARDFNYIRQAVYNLQMEGYNPIIAHMERYRCLMKRIDRVEELINMGVYLQANASSIVGENGFSTKQYLKKLIKLKYIHFVGTDAHNMDKRPPKIRKCAEYLIRKFGEEHAWQILHENPVKLVGNEYI